MSVNQGKIPLSIYGLLLARMLDSAATVGLVTIVGKQVFDMTGEELSLGLLGLAEFLPSAALVPFTGAVADRFDRRVVAAAFTGSIAVVCLALWAYVATDPTAVGPIYGLMFIFGVLRAFARPAMRALAVDLAPADVVERVVALSAVSWQAGMIAGPVMAGLLFTVDRTLPYVVLAGLLVVAAVGLVVVPGVVTERLSTKATGVQMLRDAVEGLRFVRGAPVVGAAITLDLFAVLLGGAVALLPSIAETRLGVDAIGLGLLRSAVGGGAGVITLALAFAPVTRRVGTVLLASVGVFGLATIALGLTTSFPIAMMALAVLGGADSVSVYIRNTLVPLATPPSMRGRVLALESVFIGASNELGAFESGVTAAMFGLVGAVVFGGVGTLAVVAGFWFLAPSLRHIDTFSDARPSGSDPAAAGSTA